MKRIIISLFMLLLVVCLPLVAATTTYEAMLQDVTATISSVIKDKIKVSFVSVESEYEPFSKRLITDVEQRLINSDCIVLDRSNIDSIIAELEFQTSGLVDEDQSVSIGHMLGADMIIAASAKNMVSSLHVDIQLIDIETTLVKRHLTYDLKYDTQLKNIISGSTNAIGNQSIGIGLRFGSSIEFNKAHEDMIGTGGVRPAEKSPVGFVPTLSAFYRLNESFKVQAELSYFVNNGLSIIGFYDDYTGYILDIDISYSTLDIPVMLAFNFIQKPVSVDAFAGVYASIPVSTANISYGIEGYGTLNGAVNVVGASFGVLGGFDVGMRMGPGNLLLDARFIYDFKPSKAKGDILGTTEQGLIYRKGIVVSAGYMFEL